MDNLLDVNVELGVEAYSMFTRGEMVYAVKNDCISPEKKIYAIDDYINEGAYITSAEYELLHNGEVLIISGVSEARLEEVRRDVEMYKTHSTLNKRRNNWSYEVSVEEDNTIIYLRRSGHIVSTLKPSKDKAAIVLDTVKSIVHGLNIVEPSIK